MLYQAKQATKYGTARKARVGVSALRIFVWEDWESLPPLRSCIAWHFANCDCVRCKRCQTLKEKLIVFVVYCLLLVVSARCPYVAWLCRVVAVDKVAHYSPQRGKIGRPGIASKWYLSVTQRT